MYAELINHNEDLRKLRNENYSIEIRGNFLLLHHVPYVNEACEVKFGTLVSDLTSVAGDRTISPIQNHVAYFIGEYPCDSGGDKIIGFYNSSTPVQLARDLLVNHTFSSKPKDPDFYLDYYDKMVSYVNLIVPHAQMLNHDVSPKNHVVYSSALINSPFRYMDTNTVRNKTAVVTEKLEKLKIGIVGLGGSGSYILDFIAKTPVETIELFDGDKFQQHNAYRAPGAASEVELQKSMSKVDYYKSVYAKMHNGIVAHNLYITQDNLNLLADFDFVFISIDQGVIKKCIMEFLMQRNIPFTDTGLSVEIVGDCLSGIVQLTTGTKDYNSHIYNRVDFTNPHENDIYESNIQICELNALNAVMAVIKWKKYFGFYHDFTKEHFSVYSINDGVLNNDEI
jgi:hypothetical protein